MLFTLGDPPFLLLRLADPFCLISRADAMFASLLLPLALSAASVVTAQSTTTDVNSLIAELITAPNHKGRVADLPQDSEASSMACYK